LLHVTPESERKKFDASSQLLGYMLGNALYDAYLEGRVTPTMLRRVFMTPLEEPGKARETYNKLAERLRLASKTKRGAAANL
jgi:hypothetical protein